LEYFLPDRRANSRLERETQSNIARLRSTLRRLERDYDGDGSETGEAIRQLVRVTRDIWGALKNESHEH
jgi:hypothetical protein